MPTACCDDRLDSRNGNKNLYLPNQQSVFLFGFIFFRVRLNRGLQIVRVQFQARHFMFMFFSRRDDDSVRLNSKKGKKKLIATSDDVQTPICERHRFVRTFCFSLPTAIAVRQRRNDVRFDFFGQFSSARPARFVHTFAIPC